MEQTLPPAGGPQPASMPQQTCSYCHNPVWPVDQFCSRCGRPLENLHGVSVNKQISIYLTSIFLPPFGLIWTFRYMRSTNSATRRVGIIAGVLTIASLLITIWLTVTTIQSVYKTVSRYQNLGL